MINHRPCVNGILAAVLSASILPIHGALAKEKSPVAHKTAAKPAAGNADRNAEKKIDTQDAPKEELAKPDAGGANAPVTMTQ